MSKIAYNELTKSALIDLLTDSEIPIKDLKKMKKADLIEKIEGIEANKPQNKFPLSSNFLDHDGLNRALNGEDLSEPIDMLLFGWTSSRKIGGYYSIPEVVDAVKAVSEDIDLTCVVTEAGENARITSIIELLGRETHYRFESVLSYQKREFARVYRAFNAKVVNGVKHFPTAQTVKKAVKAAFGTVSGVKNAGMKDILTNGTQEFRLKWAEISKKIPSTAGYLVEKTTTSSTVTGSDEKTNSSVTVGWASFKLSDDGKWTVVVYDGPVLKKASNDPDYIGISQALEVVKYGLVGNDLKKALIDPVLTGDLSIQISSDDEENAENADHSGFGAFALWQNTYALFSSDQAKIAAAKGYVKALRQCGAKKAGALPCRLFASDDLESAASLSFEYFERQARSALDLKSPKAQKARIDEVLKLIKGYEAVLAYSKEDLLNLTEELLEGAQKAEKALESSTPAKKRKTKAEKAFEDAQKALRASALAIYTSCLKAGMSHEDAVKTGRHADPTFDCAPPPAKPEGEKPDQA